ncbi:hypothetical protein BCV69DRAFT_211579 [Microstroma glucosiphilum]|uniref:Secreted protein n=1 Tax=Pseudomicrostroma glucosiphilum TaxID=1684307 RepID=A0A316U7S6_9BASI|nr:hypothetical protein BCV69DRAFT_211579 [Pseudomicrostroma glucosiphilum]PWN20501.1 hypothetical protein BCV69DRAFT_211579 [Pseudomicrostroma glucosiphilum]
MVRCTVSRRTVKLAALLCSQLGEVSSQRTLTHSYTLQRSSKDLRLTFGMDLLQPVTVRLRVTRKGHHLTGR